MKNKIIFTIIGLLIFLLNLDIVNAEVYDCEFDNNNLIVHFDESGTTKISQNYYQEKTIPWFLNAFYNYDTGRVKSSFDEESLTKKELDGKCPASLYMCKYEETSTNMLSIKNFISTDTGMINHLEHIYISFSANEMNEKHPEITKIPNGQVVAGNSSKDEFSSVIDACWLSNDDTNGFLKFANVLLEGVCLANDAGFQIFTSVWESEGNYLKYKDCRTVKYTGDRDTYNLACPNLSVFYGRFEKLINKYACTIDSTKCKKGIEKCDKTDASCISDTIAEVNEQENVIKNYCKEILSKYDYDGGTEEDCLESCLGIANKIKKDKIDAKLITDDLGECGFSSRLLVWINNILKWIKYILPVLVIILGIIDFIKAIAAEKDDEMKKAQGRFIRRLIAAALAFIVPLIITFILDKMGFDVYSCGIDGLE